MTEALLPEAVWVLPPAVPGCAGFEEAFGWLFAAPEAMFCAFSARDDTSVKKSSYTLESLFSCCSERRLGCTVFFIVLLLVSASGSRR